MTLRSETTKGQSWFAYILECSDGSYYVGITKDLTRRLAMHNEGKASRFTRVRRPVRYRYAEEQTTQSSARIREMELKGWRRSKKAALFRSAANILSR